MSARFVYGVQYKSQITMYPDRQTARQIATVYQPEGRAKVVRARLVWEEDR